MERQFAVTMGERQVGKVLVSRQGLYYSFQCRCDLAMERIYRLLVTCGTVSENLGILVPKDGSFMLDTRRPVKIIGEGDMQFSLHTKEAQKPITFVPIIPEEPFAYISRLKESFLMIRDGQPGIALNKMQE